MAVTYTTASARDAARVRHPGRVRVHPLELGLAGASLFALVLALVAFSGASATVAGAGNSMNLNTVAGSEVLEPVVARVFPAAADRRLAARSLFSFLVQADGGRRVVTEVRALARARVDATSIDRTPGAVEYRARLDEERARASASHRAPPQSIPALTPADVAAIKPFLSVRSRRDTGSRLLLWIALYILGFHAVSLLWRFRGIEGLLQQQRYILNWTSQCYGIRLELRDFRAGEGTRVRDKDFRFSLSLKNVGTFLDLTSRSSSQEP